MPLVPRFGISPSRFGANFALAKPQFDNYWLAFRRSSFLDDKQSVRAKTCSRQSRANFRELNLAIA